MRLIATPMLIGCSLIGSLSIDRMGGGPASAQSSKVGPAGPSPVDADEARALAFVDQNHPELGKVLASLKPRNSVEYRKAIGELAATERSLAEIKAKNPARHELALEAWRARSNVELLAARLGKSPSAEREGQLRAAIERRVDVDIRRHRFEVEQAEGAVKRAREHLERSEKGLAKAQDSLQRVETNRDQRVENRFRSLRGGKKSEPQVGPASPPPAGPSKPQTTPSNPTIGGTPR